MMTWRAHCRGLYVEGSLPACLHWGMSHHQVATIARFRAGEPRGHVVYQATRGEWWPVREPHVLRAKDFKRMKRVRHDAT